MNWQIASVPSQTLVTDPSWVEFRPVELGDVDELVECVQRTFPGSTGEILARTLGVRRFDFLTCAEALCHKAVENELSYVAYDRLADRVAGFCLAEDWVTALRLSRQGFSSRLNPAFRLLEELNDGYGAAAQPGTVLNLSLLGIDPEYGSKGLGRWLVNRVLDEARRGGYRRVVIKATGSASQALCRSLDFRVLRETRYDSFEFEGKRVFESIREPSACVLAERSL